MYSPLTGHLDVITSKSNSSIYDYVFVYQNIPFTLIEQLALRCEKINELPTNSKDRKHAEWLQSKWHIKFAQRIFEFVVSARSSCIVKNTSLFWWQIEPQKCRHNICFCSCFHFASLCIWLCKLSIHGTHRKRQKKTRTLNIELRGVRKRESVCAQIQFRNIRIIDSSTVNLWLRSQFAASQW